MAFTVKWTCPRCERNFYSELIAARHQQHFPMDCKKDVRTKNVDVSKLSPEKQVWMAAEVAKARAAGLQLNELPQEVAEYLKQEQANDVRDE